MFGFSLRPKRLDYEELEETARDIYLQVHEHRTQIEQRGAANPSLTEFVKCFDLATGCFAVYLSSKIMYQKGLNTRADLAREEKEHRYWNQELIRAAKQSDKF
jgi:hypothetical protein